MDNKISLRVRLCDIGLGGDEADVLLCLISSPKTLLEVSRVTGIPRSTVYRLVINLGEKGLVNEITTDNDRSLMSARPEALEVLVAEHEEASRARRNNLNELLPALISLTGRDANFAIRTYRGLAGIKQLLWKDLKAKTELLVFSDVPLDNVAGRDWAERYRQEIITRGIKQRCIENVDLNPISEHPGYPKHYTMRLIPENILAIKAEIVIRDDTVCLYNSLAHDVQLATEIKNPFLADFMREIFEHYWEIATRKP